jgi:hypothetical protein
MRAAFVVTLVLMGWCSQALAATPFELGDQGGVILAVSLNGRGPFRLLLDTGSTHSAVGVIGLDALSAVRYTSTLGISWSSSAAK